MVAELSRLIISNEYADVSLSDDEFSGFLFDVSMLYENYIRKLLQGEGMRLEPKDARAVAYPTGGAVKKGHRLLPDLVLHGERSTLILDAKYKWFDKNEGISREDAFQVMTYASAYERRYPRYPVRGYGFCISEERSRANDARFNQ